MASFLSGVRIVSFSTGIAGPNAARMLANYGAEVFKVESRAGGLDAFRSYGDNPEASPRFVEVNLNTRSVTLNLKTGAGVALVKELVAKSDVVMENFRPDVMPRLGLGPDELRALKPELIVVRMPGLGSTGPLSHYGTWGPDANRVFRPDLPLEPCGSEPPRRFPGSLPRLPHWRCSRRSPSSQRCSAGAGPVKARCSSWLRSRLPGTCSGRR